MAVIRSSGLELRLPMKRKKFDLYPQIIVKIQFSTFNQVQQASEEYVQLSRPGAPEMKRVGPMVNACVQRDV
jgi:hypothetical protein